MQIKLLKDHTHAGTRYLAGELLDLPPEAAAWLTAQNIGELSLIGGTPKSSRAKLPTAALSADLTVFPSTDPKEID